MAWLGICTPQPELGTPSGVFGILRELSDDEYSRYVESASEVGRFRRKRQLMEIVRANHNDYIVTLNNISKLSLSISSPDTSFEAANSFVVGVNRTLLNLFASIRTYLDHSETWLKRECGDNSSEVNSFKTVTSYEYDSNWAYRFIYKLRNFSQHCGLPLGELKAFATTDVQQGSDPTMTVDLFFLRDYLLTNFDSWGTVKKDLQEQSERFAVTPLVEAIIPSLERVEKTLVKAESGRVTSHVDYLTQLADEAGRQTGHPCIYTSYKIEGQRVDASLQRLHLDLIRETRRLIRDAAE